MTSMSQLTLDAAGQLLPRDAATNDIDKNCWGRAVAIHPDSTQNIVAVGTADNSLRVYKDHKLIYNKKLGAAKSKVKEWV